MFCDQCGASVQPDQRFCSRCGKEFSTNTSIGQPVPNRVHQHIRLLGTLWLVLSALSAVGGLVMFFLASTLFAVMRGMGAPREMPVGFMQALFSAIGLAILVKAAFEFFAGWGLMKRQPWARMLTIILSFLALLNFPLGTALGIFSLWVLLPAQAEREYQQEMRNARAI